MTTKASEQREIEAEMFEVLNGRNYDYRRMHILELIRLVRAFALHEAAEETIKTVDIKGFERRARTPCEIKQAILSIIDLKEKP